MGDELFGSLGTAQQGRQVRKEGVVDGRWVVGSKAGIAPTQRPIPAPNGQVGTRQAGESA
jgi:hypothetical protein